MMSPVQEGLKLVMGVGAARIKHKGGFVAGIRQIFALAVLVVLGGIY
ncbi:hypothetical protein [Nioella aestuarii]